MNYLEIHLEYLFVVTFQPLNKEMVDLKCDSLAFPICTNSVKQFQNREMELSVNFVNFSRVPSREIDFGSVFERVLLTEAQNWPGV